MLSKARARLTNQNHASAFFHMHARLRVHLCVWKEKQAILGALYLALFRAGISARFRDGWLTGRVKCDL